MTTNPQKTKLFNNLSTQAIRSLMGRFVVAVVGVVLMAIMALLIVFGFYNRHAGNPIMLAIDNTDNQQFTQALADQSLVIVADRQLQDSIDQIVLLFNKRHLSDTVVHYRTNTMPNLAKFDELSADLWLNYQPPTNNQSQTYPLSSNTNNADRFDFAILENDAPSQADGHTISTKPNNPPLSGVLLNDKPLARQFKYFLLSSIAQDVFIDNGLQSIEPIYDTRAFFSPSTQSIAIHKPNKP